MATAEIGALRVVLSLNAGEFSRGLERAAKGTDQFKSSISRLSDQMEAASYEFNSGMMAAQRFANVVSSIVRVTREFGSGMSAVSTLVDTNTESMKSMSEAVLAIGRRTPVALTDLTTGLYDLRSAGSTAENAMDRLERSAQLGVAGLGSTKEAVDLVTSAINAFGLQGKEADDVYNTIFKTIQAGKTTISGLAQGFGAVATTVASTGTSLKEYNAAIAALTVTGIPAAQAHTMIRAAIAGLTRESEIGTKVLQTLGAKTFKELIEKSGGLVGAFKNVNAVLGGNAENMIKLLGSMEGYGAVLSLTGKQNEAFNANLLKMNDGIDSVGEAFEKRNAGMGAAIDRMNNAFTELGIALGEALLPAIKMVSDVVVNLTTAFKSLPPEVQSAITTIGLLAAVIAPAVAAIGFFINGLSAVVGVLATVGGAITAFIAASGPIGAFIIVASAAVTAWQIFEKDITAIWNAVAEVISAKSKEIVNYVMEHNASMDIFSNTARGAITVWKIFEQDITAIWDAVTNAIAAKVQEITEWMTRLGSFVSDVFAKIWAGDFDAAMARMSEGMAPAAQKVADAFADIALQGGLVSTMLATQAQAVLTYTGPVVSAFDAEAKSVRNRNSAYSEGTQLFKEMLTPMEQVIFKQMEIHALWAQGTIDAETYGRAMAQASVYSAKNMDALASSVSSNLSTIFGDSKAVAIATALINTYQGITKALATYPPPIAQIMAGIQAAAGFAQVAKIRSMTAKGSGGGGGGGGGGEASAAASAAAVKPSQTMYVDGIDPNSLFTGGMVRNLAEKLIDFQRDGGQVVLGR